jgi:hypothetical protein
MARGQGPNLTSTHTAWRAVRIDAHHQHVFPLLGLQHRLEDAMVDTLSEKYPNINVHWARMHKANPGLSQPASNAS